jgi:hypothetical protein
MSAFLDALTSVRNSPLLASQPPDAYFTSFPAGVQTFVVRND